MATAENVTFNNWVKVQEGFFTRDVKPKKMEDIKLPKEILDEMRKNPEMWKFVLSK